MEKIIDDLSALLDKFDATKIEYYVLYDLSTLVVTGVYPSHALTDKSEAICIDRELADKINSGKINMSTCRANLYNRTIEIIEDTSVISIDTVLHRIIEKKWITKKANYDILINYDLKKKLLTFNIDPKYYKDVSWPKSLELKFMITEYNDPHVLYETISFSLGSILEKKKIKIKINIDGEFSIFTKRVFPNYQLEIL